MCAYLVCFSIFWGSFKEGGNKTNRSKYLKILLFGLYLTPWYMLRIWVWQTLPSLSLLWRTKQHKNQYIGQSLAHSCRTVSSSYAVVRKETMAEHHPLTDEVALLFSDHCAAMGWRKKDTLWFSVFLRSYQVRFMPLYILHQVVSTWLIYVKRTVLGHINSYWVNTFGLHNSSLICTTILEGRYYYTSVTD